MNIPVEEIRKEIPPEKYGLLEWLQGDLYRTHQVLPYRGRQILTERICIVKPRESFEKGYDCYEATKKLNKILNRDGIRNDIYKGPDELGIWDDHFFAMTDNGIVDAIDLYPIFGARHFPLQKIPQNELSESKYTIVDIEDQGPLCYSKPAKNTKLLSRIGISRVSAFDRAYMEHIIPTIVTLDSFLIEHSKPVQRYEIEAIFDEFSLRKELDASGVMPHAISKNEIMKAFNGILDKKTVKLKKRTYSLELASRGVLNEKKIRNKEVNSFLKEKTDQNLDTLASLTMKIPCAKMIG